MFKKILTITIFLVISVNVIASTGHETGNGGDGVLENGKITLLDSLEFDFELIDIDSYGFSDQLNQILITLENKLGIELLRANDLVWAITNRELEDIKDEGAIRYQYKENLVQIAVQKNKVVVIYKEYFDLLKDNLNKSPKDNDKLGLILHELLIASLLEHNYFLKTPEIGTRPVRELVWYSRQKVLDTLPDHLFLNILSKLDYVFGDVIINNENASFHINQPRAIFGNKLFPIKRIFFEESNQLSAWCYYFANKLKLLNSNDQFKDYTGEYESESAPGVTSLGVSTGLYIDFTDRNELIFSPEESFHFLTKLTCRKIKKIRN